jgi:hypothetical protein
MKITLLAFIGCLAVTLGSRGQPAPGSYAYDFASTNLPVFVMDRSTFSTNMGGTSAEMTIELTPRGRFQGALTGHYDDGAVIIDLGGRLHGSVSSEPPEYYMVLASRGPVQGTAYGRRVVGSFALRVVMDVNATTQVGRGTQHVTVCLAGRGCQSMSEPVSLPLLTFQPGEGDWSLGLTISNRDNHVTGVAQARMDTGRTLDFRVRGAYSPRRGTCKLLLRGTGEAAGVVLQLAVDDAVNLTSIRGKFFGQRIDATMSLPSKRR